MAEVKEKLINNKQKKKRFHLTKATKDKLKGLVFVSPFIIGVILFFIYPIYMSVKLSFGKLDNIVGFKVSWIGIENYLRAFTIDMDFAPMFLSVVRDTLVRVPMIIILALIISILINQDIKGRTLFRIAFFIPFLLGNGEVMRQLIYQGVDKQVLSIADGDIIPYEILNYFGSTIVNAVQTVLGIIVTVLWSSGVQILLFLSGLQSISPALYEAAKIDGATQWEIFWKVTIPMISPIMLLNIVYTIVDSFTNIRNPLLEYIQSYGFTKAQFEYGAALGWIYFIFIGFVVAVVFGLMKGYMHTNEVEEVKRRDKQKQRRVIAIERKAKTRA
ncbi:MAG: sugar ABC transporter permease [Clostridiales bacterium]|nr:sugar ABC transporter permease [Clostridiales bacterium]